MAEAIPTQPYGALVGDMYSRWTLDCLVEIAHAVSIDYVARPEFYRGTDVPDNIADLWSSYGYQRNYPNRGQRSDLNGPVFGASDGYTAPKGVTPVADKFRQYRDPLFKACIAYTERTTSDATSGLKNGVIQAMKFFPQYLRNFEGNSIQSTYEQEVFVSDLSFQVLRSGTVSGAFGVSPAPSSTWPLDSDDQRGAQLVNAITDALQLKDMALTQEKFTKLRAMAQDGRDALEATLEDDPTGDANFEDLVEKVYAWAKSVDYYMASGAATAK